MPGQANMLVDRMIQKLGQNAFNADWKLVTFFIGGNDLCAYCEDEVCNFIMKFSFLMAYILILFLIKGRYSADNYRNNVKAALDILHARMPRTIVNFVTVLNVAELEDLHEGAVCQNMQL